ncbi:DODA-type extradiol aromatic ring-opening family dioxygenase [Longivirga aurantiaca]|uniref:Catechol 1,2-dioxygenase n=1 Tax=Longivirga aurantiaca TaxID=1837743 RepID=A0ABW1T5Z6_9ACTN
MGEVVGAGLLSHVPTIMAPLEERLALNGGKEISLVPALHRLRAEKFEQLDYDTVIVLDSHWFTTVEFIVTSQDLRAGLFTAEELPRGMCRIPYEWKGDRELAEAIAAEGEPAGTWITAIDDPYLPLYYPSINLWSYLGKGMDKQWISISVCQTGETDDFLRVGRAIRAAIEKTDRKVIIIATGSMSHTFYKLKELRKHESSDPSHIITQKARDMDHERLEWFFEGRHDRVLETMPEFLAVRPEGMFAHYLMMAAALGEDDFSAPGVQYGDYENAIGTSQVHVWFDRPEAGWTAPRTT